MKKIFLLFALLIAGLVFFPKTHFAIVLPNNSFSNSVSGKADSSKMPPSNINTNKSYKYSEKINDDELPLETRIKTAGKLIQEEEEIIPKNEFKEDIINIVKENREIFLQEEKDPAVGDYYSSDGYESLMILIEKFKDPAFLPFLTDLTKKIKDFTKSSLVPSTEYITWALKSTTLENREKLSSEKLKEISSVLNSVYKYAEDNQISNWANSALIEMAKSGIEEANIKKKEPARFFAPLLTKTDKQKIKNLYNEISYNKIKNTVKKLQSFRTRHSGTKGHRKAAQFIIEGLKKAGLSVKTQEFKSYGSSFKNIISTIKGDKKSKDKIVVCAHYDSIALDLMGKRAPAPGANDNGTGVATLLEIARVLKKSNISFNSTIEFVFFDAEEIGKRGSDYYVRKAMMNEENIEAVLNIDSVGWDKDKRLEIVSNKSSRRLMNSLKKIFQQILPSQKVENSVRDKGIADEHNFWQGDHRGSYHAVLLTSDMASPDPRINSSADSWGHIQPKVLKDSTELSLIAAAALADPLEPKGMTVRKLLNQLNSNDIKVDGKNILQYTFSHKILKDILSAFNSIPESHLPVLNRITFDNLKFQAGIFDYDNRKIIVSTKTDDLAAKAIVHETGHLIYHTLKEKIQDMDFKGDYDLLSKFYYTSGTAPSKDSIVPEGRIDETFAVMYQMYLTEHKRLEEWIKTEGTDLSKKNYKFLKNTVFREKRIKNILED